MAPAEQRIAGKLRSQLRSLEASPQQLLREFLRNKELVSRESVRKELVSERCVDLVCGSFSEGMANQSKVADAFEMPAREPLLQVCKLSSV